MGKPDQRVDNYITNAPDFAKPILAHLRQLVHATCPNVQEDWKWSFPHFVYRNTNLCHMAAFKAHCAFGFWKAALLSNEEGLLEIKQKEAMGNLGRITSLADLPPDEQLAKYILAAMNLAEQGAKLPAKPKKTINEKDALITPNYLLESLADNVAAAATFASFSYSQKKEYIEWLEDAKSEATRQKRLADAISWMADGKTRHWKYKKD